MSKKDNWLLCKIDTITAKLELFSLAFGLDKDERDSFDSYYNVHQLVLGEKLEQTLKDLDFMRKLIESGDYNIPNYTEEYNKTLYIKVIKRIYIFLKADESGCFECYDPSDGEPYDHVPVSTLEHKKLVEGMQRLAMAFDEEATDILRKLLDYLEKANLPILELSWEYQTLVKSIIGAVYGGASEEYLMMKLDEILITCGLGEWIPNIGEPVEEEKDE